jgi:hypothetical protein
MRSGRRHGITQLAVQVGAAPGGRAALALEAGVEVDWE